MTKPKATSAKPIGIVRFPGSNCDFDVARWVAFKGMQSRFVWYQDSFDTKEFEGIIVPGGFSFGDYLRSGALAARSKVMNSVREFVSFGGPVLGICNGFQILTEAHILPGALLHNTSNRFLDTWVKLKKQNASAYFDQGIPEQVRLPIAHGEGRYFIDPEGLKKLQDQDQIWFTYQGANPNGSLEGIAGICSANKKVAGLMPHPERAFTQYLGGTDGVYFL